jgi:site-specific recombinase XerD
MRALHLKRVGEYWHYQRRRPKRYSDIEPRPIIRFSLKARNFAKARALAAEHSLALDRQWAESKACDVSLKSQDMAKRYSAANATAQKFGFQYRMTEQFSDDELLLRMRALILGQPTIPEQKAILGLVPEPKMTPGSAFDRFWEHIKDEWMRLSHDQQRAKRNIYLKAIRNFGAIAGELPLYEIERQHALQFRSWWIRRVEKEGLKPYTGNREINSLRRLLNVNYDIDSVSQPNPFAGVRLKQEIEVSRIPLTTEQIKAILAPGALDGIHEDFQRVFRLLVNTGMRPVEAIGLELRDIKVDHEIPHVHVRRNSIRVLKTDHSERLLPLLGVSLDAAQELAEKAAGASGQEKTCMPLPYSINICGSRALLPVKSKAFTACGIGFRIS